MTGDLDIKKHARDLERLIQERRRTLALPEMDHEIGIRHLAYMCRCVYNEQVSGRLALIWIGYVQGVLRAGGGPNVEELMQMMRNARESD
ncbi:MAG: hypothetical protein DHS20C01_32310 [marine bacterium B5-7]|nr:MAG: hypothetical protein DHS20C01_32310 [marine bacterium B5-7]